eukprot:3932141-Rhodomonas_salina.1
MATVNRPTRVGRYRQMGMGAGNWAGPRAGAGRERAVERRRATRRQGRSLRHRVRWRWLGVCGGARLPWTRARRRRWGSCHRGRAQSRRDGVSVSCMRTRCPRCTRGSFRARLR